MRNHSLTINRTAHPAPPPTRRACAAATLFAITIDDAAPTPPSPRAFDLEIKPASITCIAGPSASGKSTLLRDIARAARNESIRTIHPPADPLPAKPCVDLLKQPLTDALRTLSAAGLADVGVFTHRPAELSEGQRARLRLALTLSKLPKKSPAIIILDEFASTLDPTSARALARCIARWTRNNPRAHLLLATPRTDIIRHLAPATTITTSPVEPLVIRTHTPRALSEYPIEIEPATIEDFNALARYHYRSAKPATVVRVLRAIDKQTKSLAAVLVVSMPTLNAAWRSIAWPGRYDMRDHKPRDTARINRELRCISRVIVDPRFRGLSIASRLVRAYLDNPLTPCTEAIAAMGLVCPFFRSAGMTEYILPPSRRDARLLDAFHHARIDQWRLATPTAALSRAGGAAPFIDRETQRWARSSRATHRYTNASAPDRFHRACRALIASPIAYAHTKTN